MALLSEFFEDFINDGIMMADKFGFAPLSGIKGQYEHKFDEDGDAYDEEVAVDTGVYMQPQTKGKYVDIIHSDNPYVVFDFVKGFGFDMTDVLRVTACTIFFHDFSRSTSQQITRHFAGISRRVKDTSIILSLSSFLHYHLEIMILSIILSSFLTRKFLRRRRARR